MAMASRAQYPNSAFGYWRGQPMAGGSGSGMGQANAGAGVLSQGLGSIGTGGGWEPSILYLLGLVVVEMVVFGFIGRALS